MEKKYINDRSKSSRLFGIAIINLNIFLINYTASIGELLIQSNASKIIINTLQMQLKETISKLKSTVNNCNV